jgi:hypothetical protein
VSSENVSRLILPGRVTRNKPPKLSGGYFFRQNGKGWDIRRSVIDENGERKQPYISYLSESNWREMTKANRTDAELRKALTEWLSERI